jgi:hypothetical protein
VSLDVLTLSEVTYELLKDFVLTERDQERFVFERPTDKLAVAFNFADGWLHEVTPATGFPYGVAPVQITDPEKAAGQARDFTNPVELSTQLIRIAHRVHTEVPSALAREATLGHLEQAIRSLGGQA